MLWLKKFAQKFGEKNWRFWLKTELNNAKFDHNIGFWGKRHFCQKLSKIAENCDHNIDPWIFKFSDLDFFENFALDFFKFLHLFLNKDFCCIGLWRPLSSLLTTWNRWRGCPSVPRPEKSRSSWAFGKKTALGYLVCVVGEKCFANKTVQAMQSDFFQMETNGRPRLFVNLIFGSSMPSINVTVGRRKLCK
jgi:hypothetical protein